MTEKIPSSSERKWRVVSLDDDGEKPADPPPGVFGGSPTHGPEAGKVLTPAEAQAKLATGLKILAGLHSTGALTDAEYRLATIRLKKAP